LTLDERALKRLATAAAAMNVRTRLWLSMYLCVAGCAVLSSEQIAASSGLV